MVVVLGVQLVGGVGLELSLGEEADKGIESPRTSREVIFIAILSWLDKPST